MGKTPVTLQDLTAPGDFIVHPAVWEEREGDEGRLDTLIEHFIKAGYKSIGLIDRYCDGLEGLPEEIKEAKQRVTLTNGEIRTEAERISELKGKYGKDIAIFFGLSFDSWFRNTDRFKMDWKLLDECLDYLVIENVHSKNIATILMANLLEDSNKIQQLREELDGMGPQPQILIPNQAAPGSQRREEIIQKLTKYMQIFQTPTYNLSHVAEVQKQLPNVRVGLFAPSIEFDFTGYDPVLKTLAGIVVSRILGPNASPENFIHAVHLLGVSPDEFAGFLQRQGLFLILPFNHRVEGVIEDPSKDGNPATEAFFQGAGPYLQALTEKRIPLVPGSGFPFLQQTEPCDLSGRLAQLKGKGYTISGFSNPA